MKDGNPLLLGQIAVHEGFVTLEQLEECLKIQESGDPPGKLGAILVEKGYVTRDRLEALMEIQRLRLDPIAADPEQGGLFGQIALRFGHVTQLQLAECLRQQQDLSRDGSPVLLGQILLRKNYITTDQFLHILRTQKKEVVKCPGCDTLYDAHGTPEGAKFVCARCGTVTQVPYRQTEHRLASGDAGRPAFLRHALPEAKGESIGRYLILEQIGQGGMGIVYKVLHRDLNRTFALKVLKTGDLTTFDTVRRFQREARLAARLNHPHIVAVHDAGEENGIHYIAMEFVDGDPLSARLIARRGRMRDTLILMEKIIRAVAYAHGQGVVHRDLKPANIMLDRQGEPHIMDFGLAKQTFEGSLLTRSGAFLGTPFYMAPEQIQGKGADPQSDVYTLGVILYEILTARLPQSGQNSAEVFNRIINVEPPDVRELNARVHPDLQTICMKALEKERRARYPSAEAMAEDLRRHLDGEAILARPVGLVERTVRRVRKNPALAVAAAALLLLAGVAAWTGISAVRHHQAFRDHLARARIHWQAGDYGAAHRELQQARALRPDSEEATLLLDEVTDKLIEEGRVRTQARRAEAGRQQALPLVAEGREMIRRLEARIAAEGLSRAEIEAACTAAERTLEEALVLARDHEEALFWMARSRTLRGDFDGAIRLLTDACDASAHLGARFERGRLFLRRYRRPRGLPGLLARDDRPLFTDPSPASPSTRRFRDLARADLDEVLAESRNRWMAHYAEAATLFLALQFRAAEEKISAYMKSHPGDPEALALRALCRLYRARPDEALGDLDLALRYRPLDGSLRDWRAITRYLMGDAAGAVADLTREPADDRMLCIRGTIRYKEGEFESALADFHRAVESAPRRADALAGRAAAAAALGRLGEADADYTRALELQPEEARFHEDRGLLRLRAGRRREAARDLERAVELAPGRRGALQASIKACKSP